MTQDGQTLYAGEHVRAVLRNPGREVLIVSFDHWRKTRQGFPAWQPSATVAERGFSELVVVSSRNDWFLSPELAGLRRALDLHCGQYRAVRCLAFSMGGYGALLLSRALHLRRAVLVSPQWSVFPEKPPHDRRFWQDAAMLDAGLGDLTGQLAPRLRGVVLFDPAESRIDADHAEIIAANAPRIAKLALPFGGHPATQHLVQTGQYRFLRDLALGGKTDPRHYHQLHVAARRTSPGYRAKLQDYLNRRAARHS